MRRRYRSTREQQRVAPARTLIAKTRGWFSALRREQEQSGRLSSASIHPTAKESPMSPTRLTIQGTKFTVIGKFDAHTQAQLIEMIIAAGGTTTISLSGEVGCLVVGEEAQSTTYNTALLLGLPIIGEEDLLAALNGEEVWIDEEERAEDTDRRALFGEVRSLLHDAAPSRTVWEALTKLLDRCAPEQLEPLVYYVGEHLEQWERGDQMEELVGSAYDLDDPRSTMPLPQDRKRGIIGEVRVAPERWVGEMVQGSVSVKHSLVRALDLSSSGLNGTQICKLLENPHLTRIEHLALPTSKKLTKKLVRKLCEPPLLETLEMLRLGDIPNHSGVMDNWFAEHGTSQGSLKELDLSEYRVGMLLGFLEQPYFENVTRMCVHYWYFELFRHAIPPEIEDLEIVQPDLSEIATFIETEECAHRLKRLRIRELYEFSWAPLLEIDFPGHLEVLELQSAELFFPHLTQIHVRTFNKAIYGAKLLEHVDVFEAGPVKEWLDLEKLARLFPNLEVR
jgi:hypothetical protein